MTSHTMTDQLADFIRDRRVVVLSGAGCSTGSGIPDYRGPGTARRARNPIQFKQFVEDEAWRSRYWARSIVGWPRVRDARPNPAHLEVGARGWKVITQNVDGLHQQGGSTEVVELHGALSEVVCLGCEAITSRHALQEVLLELNPHLRGRTAPLAPDGDAELVAPARVPSCAQCQGVLKPHVVFFGENVPRDRVNISSEWVRSAEVLLVLGSSLTVFSGYRFVKRASEWGVDVGIVNLGSTRGDALATLKLDAEIGALLSGLDQPNALL